MQHNFPRSRNNGCHAYAPSAQQILDFWHVSELKLPQYRHKYGWRYHPYPRYPNRGRSESLIPISTIDEPDHETSASPMGGDQASVGRPTQGSNFGGQSRVLAAEVANLVAAAERILQRVSQTQP